MASPTASYIHEKAGSICIDPDVAAALPGSLVCDMALAEVPNGHLRPVGALHLFDVRN